MYKKCLGLKAQNTVKSIIFSKSYANISTLTLIKGVNINKCEYLTILYYMFAVVFSGMVGSDGETLQSAT